MVISAIQMDVSERVPPVLTAAMFQWGDNLNDLDAFLFSCHIYNQFNVNGLSWFMWNFESFLIKFLEIMSSPSGTRQTEVRLDGWCKGGLRQQRNDGGGWAKEWRALVHM